MGGGIAAAGFGLVNWVTLSKIAASWVVSVFGGIVAGSLLFLIEIKIMRPKDPMLLPVMGAGADWFDGWCIQLTWR